MEHGEESPLMSRLPSTHHGAHLRTERLGQMRQLPRAEMEALAKREVQGTHPSPRGHARADGARQGQQQGDGTSGQSVGKSGTPGK